MSLRTLSNFSVTLSCDADPAPGGYVVPQEGNVTFTCHYSMSESCGGVLWEVELSVPGGRASFTASKRVARVLVTSQDTTILANPASLTISNVTSENN